MVAKSLSFNPPLLAHRGASAYAPENTLLAFQKAKEMGAAWVEFDVMLCASGEVVVFHDEDLKRTTNGQGLVADSAYRYLKTLDAGSWFDPRFAEARISTLGEVLHLLAKLGLAANIELKAEAGREEALVQAVLKEPGLSDLSSLLFSSFSLETLRVLRSHSANCPIGLLIDDWFQGWEQVLVELNCSTLNLNQDLLRADTIELVLAQGLPILAYTVNDPLEARALYGFGVTALFTDCPDQLTKVL